MHTFYFFWTVRENGCESETHSSFDEEKEIARQKLVF
jgi:hypothetical protein